MTISVCAVTELAPGDVRVVQADVAVAVFRTDDGALYAVDDTCTHQRASLAEGWVEGDTVECPLHASCFDLRTGQPTGPPATLPVRTHEVRVVDGHIWLEPAG
ncbi:bifunctional 3-phenylpropionate/cinnamic acid dioxygenase ferredoxin subunit [soil metagenome]